ncbi:MAG: acyl carrier protein [Proteobacteria bacterium]|nr:acyl carrier protein [Pseudomonadota bacterium]MCP4916038.1 acyl carrier protein [Pseudomonadota bacterium]
MSDDALKLRLKEIILEVCDLEGELSPADIQDDGQLINADNGLDLTSLDAVEIASAIEYEFGVRIQDLSAAKKAFRSIDTLAATVAAARA